MKSSSLTNRLLSVVLAFSFALALHAQVVTSGITGVVRDTSARPLTGTTVSALHVPTGTTYTATTTATGRFTFRGLPPGGPYTVSVAGAGMKPTERTEVYTELGKDIDVRLDVAPAEVITMERMTVAAAANDLDSGSAGAGSILSEQRLATKPSSERSLADLISANPLVTLRSFGGDREEAQITAVGQNNRFNSIQIDGSRINDQFGLNSTGLASFFNPLSIDALEQISVQVSPYDVSQAGFTGASINAVTKAGTNRFQGSLYYYFRGDELLGVQMQGENVRERTLTGAKIVPKLDRRTYGFTFGGPIIRNRLFFFTNYEKFQSESSGRDPRLDSVPATLTSIVQRFGTYNTASGRSIPWGNPVSASTTNAAEDEKKIAKLDWNITAAHRASLRYSSTEGVIPQFGNFGNATLNNYLTLSGGPVTALDGHFYSQRRKEESWAGQVFSQWTPDFKTELKYSTTTQDQFTPTNSAAPQVAIYGLGGTDLTNRNAVANGVLIAGTERFRHGNQINVDTKQMSATGTYFRGNFIFSGGVEREQSDFFNLFRQGSYGLVGFRTVADFLNDAPTRIERSVFDPSRRPVGDISDFTTTGVFGQANWAATPNLNLTAGIRYEFVESDTRPATNRDFFAATGFRNEGSVDGADSISPRVSFNWALDQERSMQVRGGIGHFSGRAPWVIFSNSFNDIGVGSFTQISAPVAGATTLAPGAFTTYLRQFDPANPIGTASDNGSGRRNVNWTDEKIKMPAVWRANLAVDRKLPFFNSSFTIEWVETRVDRALFIRHENLKPLVPTATSGPAVGADGRRRFSGNTFTNPANTLFPGYLDLYRISNVRAGMSRYISLSWDRPIRRGWGFNASYTRGKATEAQAIGQTTASGQWERNVVFNQGAIEEGTADFEIRDRVQLSLTREFRFLRDHRTRVSLYYEGRSGNPYSWVYTGSDLNGDGRNDNDLLAVPSGPGDSRFDFSGLSATQTATYFEHLVNTGLSQYGGGIAPKNGSQEPWTNRLDLKFSHTLPLAWRSEVELFFDFINFGSFLSKDVFGYYEEASSQSNDVFRRRFLGGASYGPDGRIRPTVAAPSNVVIDNGQSRWRIQLGARVKF